MSVGRLALNAFASSGQVLVSAALLFFFYRVLLSYLSVEQIGLWGLIVGSVSVARLSEFGLGTGVVRYVAHDLGADAPEMAARTITMGALGVLAFIGATSLIAYPIALHYLALGIPAYALSEARQLLPLALVALVIGSVGNAFTSALDGLQHMAIRAGIQLSSNVFQLLAAVLLLPRYGLVSLGWIQIAQAVLVLALNAFAVFRLMNMPFEAYLGWHTTRFRELLTFGGSIQLAAIGQMLFEPVVKILLTAYSGLALVGYFQMADRVTQQFRTILVSAYNAMVPYVAQQIGAGGTKENTNRAYIFSSRLMFAASFAYFAAVAAALPLVLKIWSNQVDPLFLQVALIMWVGWSLNALAAPAYFTSLAVGQLRWIIMSQALIGGLNLALGLIGNHLIGGLGVLYGSALALSLGSLLMPIFFTIYNDVPIASLFDRWLIPGFLLWLGCGAGIWLYGASNLTLPALIALPFGAGTLAAIAFALNPFSRSIANEMLVRFRRN